MQGDGGPPDGTESTDRLRALREPARRHGRHEQRQRRSSDAVVAAAGRALRREPVAAAAAQVQEGRRHGSRWCSRQRSLSGAYQQRRRWSFAFGCGCCCCRCRWHGPERHSDASTGHAHGPDASRGSGRRDPCPAPWRTSLLVRMASKWGSLSLCWCVCVCVCAHVCGCHRREASRERSPFRTTLRRL